MTARQRFRVTIALVLAMAAASQGREAFATTTYGVRLNTSALVGVRAGVAFDLTGTQFNGVSILDFQHNGRFGMPSTRGGLVSGDLVLGLNPALTTSMNNNGADDTMFYLTSLVVNFDSLGSSLRFAVDLTEIHFFPDQPPDEWTLSLINANGLPLFPTADPLGANALCAVDISGLAGGDLTVFAPMTFVPPDSLILAASPLGVSPDFGTTTRLRFRSVYPNPTAGGIRFEFDVPASGGHAKLDIYDLAGRIVERVFGGFLPGGPAAIEWSGRDSERGLAPAGIYFARLEMGGQTTVRKVALGR
jgi:hypothetical protein